MMWEISLIGTSSSTNAIGDPIQTPIERTIFAEKASIRQSEFYQAATTDLKPELTFKVWKREYLQENQLRFEGRLYKIIRTYEVDEKIELVCEGISGEYHRDTESG